MSKEIERKFLVKKAKWNAANKPVGVQYQQGYLCIDNGKTIRVRITDSNSFITIKGKLQGDTREEYEYEIPKQDAHRMINTLSIGSIFKTRYKIKFQNKLWEVDEFSGRNIGLAMAEIELEDKDEIFDLPEWVGKEVTDDERYYNANLVMNPYEKWSPNEDPV